MTIQSISSVKNILAACFCFLLICRPAVVSAQRIMENLGRGLIAVNQGNGRVYLGWRMLGTDPDNVSFNVYKLSGNESALKLNPKPISESTNFVDEHADSALASTYFVKTVINGIEKETSAAYTLPADSPVRQ